MSKLLKNRILKSICTVLLLIPLLCFAQTGPGGVGKTDGTSNLEFWYMAQGENYSNGDFVDTIFDKSGNSRTITAATNCLFFECTNWSRWCWSN